MRTREDAIRTAAFLWAGADVPHWYDNEYLRGQVELLADLFGSPFIMEVDWEEVKDWYEMQISLVDLTK